MSQQHKRYSTISRQAKRYLEHRRSLGFELGTSGLVLMQFARFADRLGHRGPLTTELILRWISYRQEDSSRYRAERLSIVRGFARYLAARDGATQVPDARLLSGSNSYRRQQPHVYSEQQLGQLVRQAARLSPSYPLRPKTYSTLFGLLASTGLRISEALSLRQCDVDLGAGLLRIEHTKFRKSRLVPLHPSAVRALRSYADVRHDHDRTARRTSDHFFVGRHGHRLPRSTVRCTFRRLCNTLGWRRGNGALALPPRIHDLRHTFACLRLLRWYRSGVDVEHAIAALSTYLGHGKVTDTYWYLSGTAELLSIASGRFERFARQTGRMS